MNPEITANAAMICGTVSSCTLHWLNTNASAIGAIAAAVSCIITVLGFLVNLHYKRRANERQDTHHDGEKD